MRKLLSSKNFDSLVYGLIYITGVAMVVIVCSIASMIPGVALGEDVILVSENTYYDNRYSDNPDYISPYNSENDATQSSQGNIEFQSSYNEPKYQIYYDY